VTQLRQPSQAPWLRLKSASGIQWGFQVTARIQGYNVTLFLCPAEWAQRQALDALPPGRILLIRSDYKYHKFIIPCHSGQGGQGLGRLGSLRLTMVPAKRIPLA
jgi:hypothetical protein